MAIDSFARNMAASAAGAGGGGSLDVGIEQGEGIEITGTDPKKISNDGVTNITESDSNANDGTVKVIFGNKISKNKHVAVKGLKNSAYTEKTTTVAAIETASDVKLPTEKAVRAELNKKVNSNIVGAANGIATLDANSKLTSTQLPDHNHASSKINAMTGYSKDAVSEASAVSADDTLNKAIAKIEKTLDTKQASGTYATGNSAGDALKAVALNNTSAIGSTTQGVYIDANGKPQAMTHTLAQSVTADSKLTDTTYTKGNGIDISDANVIKNTGVIAIDNSPSVDPDTHEAVADGTFQVNTNGSISYIGIKGLNSAAYKGVTTSVTSGSENLITSGAVYTGLSAKVNTTNVKSTYSATGEDPVNGKAVASAVSGAVSDLDATGASNIDASKTIKSWSETDGIVSIDTQDIAIKTGAVTIPEGYVKPETASGIAVGDNVTDAFGKIEKALDGKQVAGKYATGDDNGVALKAKKLNNTAAIGSATKGVYISASGEPTEMTHSLEIDVPSTAKLTDTTYSTEEYSGIDISADNKISNTGLRGIVTSDESDANGTFRANVNGEQKVYAIKGLNNAAYLDVDSTTMTSTSTNLPTSTAVASYVGNAIANIPSPMQYKGTVGTDGTITDLPTPAATGTNKNIGFTYKVCDKGSYTVKADGTKQSAKPGDMFICDGTEWTYIPSADDPVTTDEITNGSKTLILNCGNATL